MKSDSSNADALQTSHNGGFSQTMRINIVPEPVARPIPRIRKPPIKQEPADRKADDAAEWETRYVALLDGMYDAALVTNASGRIENANLRAVDFFRFSRKELMGRNAIDFISGADAGFLKTLVSDMRNQRFALIQAYCVRRDGRVFPAEISVNFADSVKEKLCFFIRDVTQRKQREDQLLEQHNALECSRSGIVVSGLDGVMTYVNPAVADMWGYAKASDLIGQNVVSLWAAHSRAEAEDVVKTVASGQEAWRGDLIARKQDGSVFQVNVSVGQNVDSEEVLAGLVFSFADISDRVKAMDRLRELDETKSRFVAEASHELRTPLAIINEFVSLIRDEVTGPVNEKQKECLTSVLRNCSRLSALINSMLDLARIEAGKVEVHRKSCAIKPILTDCYESFLETCKGHKQTLTLNAEYEYPNVYCDADSVNKIMVNLLGNAVKFTPEGGSITISCLTEGRFIRVAVEDTGRGIPPEAQAKVFEAFSQVEREDGPGAKGTGLGLAIVKKLVEINGGIVGLESAPGKGSRFSFTLPLFERDARVPKRVLVVDDDPIILDLVTRALQNCDMPLDVKTTLSGLESLRISGEHDPHLVILDVRLGDISGAEIIETLRRRAGTNSQVKVLTISGDSNMINETMRKGADDCLLKPFDIETLCRKVKGLLAKGIE